jgi:nicotinate-nucleotide pyrophosphorylase (carboxylating)
LAAKPNESRALEIFQQLDLTRLIEGALAEDLGHGDITTAATVAPGQPGIARIVVKQAQAVFCGGPLLARVFALSNGDPKITSLAPEGVRLEQGAIAAEIEGLLAGLLIGERTALNLVQLMSGIATLTRQYADAVAGTRARIIDTRKTHPGLRAIEKYAVRVGGGFNHRFGLDSGVLIKDNHIAAAGSIRSAVERTRRLAPHTLIVEVECEKMSQVEEALKAGADAILLDNMAPEKMRRARAMAGDAVILEASGGITLENVRAIAETGVDLISVGALTHSAPAVNLSMRIKAA